MVKYLYIFSFRKFYQILYGFLFDFLTLIRIVKGVIITKTKKAPPNLWTDKDRA